MTPTYLNSSPSPFPNELSEDHQHHHHLFSPNPQASSFSSSVSYYNFFSSTQDQSGFFHQEIQKPQNYQEDNNSAFHGGSYDMKQESDNGLKLCFRKKEDSNEGQNGNSTPALKWVSSKMRLMQKMRGSYRTTTGLETSSTPLKFQDHQMQQQPSSPLETDNSSNSPSNNINAPIRVCADCNTTKTPLWRSGPRGPKSLCNACGIRQRKARRAMAAAAAAAADANGTIIANKTTPGKAKMQLKDKMKNINNGHVVPYKKRNKFAAGPSDHGSQKKLCFEDLLLNFSKNLAFHRVFPQEEKEAAILLMALSCGLVHG